MVRIDNIQLPDFPLLLAPMEDVSDPPFRAVCKDKGADLMYTEFISSEGLIRDAIKSRKKLDIFDYERPVGIQIFGGDEDSLSMAAKIVEVTNPDLLDINFGCPVKKVALKGAGAGVLKDIDLMVRLTSAVVKSTSLPVTVKTRLGWDDKTRNIEEVAERLQDVGIKALAIHGRTRTQMYKGEADLPSPTIADRIAVCRKHLNFSVQWKGPVVGINEMRRHYANYLKGLPNIKEYRNRLVTLPTEEEVNEVLNEVAVTYAGFEVEKTPIELINYHEKCPI